MIGFLQFLEESLSTLFPILGLFTLCIIGYYFVTHGFTPKALTAVKQKPDLSLKNLQPQMKQRVLTNRELGIEDLREMASLPPETQQRLQKEQMVKDYTAKSPDEAANVIRGWLGE